MSISRPRLRVLLRLWWVCIAVGCATNPVTGQREVVFLSEEEEREAGAAAAEQVDAEMGIVRDAALTRYVDAVGQRVAAHAPQSGIAYSFHVVDLEEPNAFALPGGYVYVSRGLLTITNSEDELAVTVAHEVVHVAARHHAQRHARLAGVGLLALPGLLAGAILPGPVGDLVRAPVALGAVGLIARYSRDQELESDREGQRIAAEAGYDPGALVDFLGTLERETELMLGERRTLGWLDSHPSTPRRAAEASKRAATLTRQPRPGVAEGRAGFLERMDGLLVGPNPAGGVFDGQRFLHPDLRFVLVFPEQWQTLNTPRVVGALSDRGDAQVVLQQHSKGEDPREAASAFLVEASKHMRVEVARLEAAEINGLEAVHGLMAASGKGHKAILDLTWIAYDGFVYLLSGIVEKDYTDRHRAAFEQVARSFRPLTAEERATITELRLRVVSARDGETLAELGRRTGNAWDVERTAVANALEPLEPLSSGRRVKIAVRQSY